MLNRVLTSICGSKRSEIIGGRKLRNDDLRNLYSSRNIIRMMKSRRMKWAKVRVCSTRGDEEKCI
jgi:hypothetical protein